MGTAAPPDPGTIEAKTVACIGAGNVGRAWAIVFARAGHQVRLFDVSESALAIASQSISTSLQSLHESGSVDNPASIEARITSHSTLIDALAGADHVQESISERLDLKRSVFTQLDELCPPTAVLASSTSELVPSGFMQVARHPERCLVAHPLNPPFLIPLVELCPAPATSQSVIDATEGLLQGCGMSCLKLNREIGGFVVNRLQGALLREALRLTENGYCTPQDVDRAVTQGLGRRWVFLGPFATGQLNSSTGFSGYMEMLGPAWRRLFDEMREDVSWTEESVLDVKTRLGDSYPEARISEAQAWRDRRLMALNRHLGLESDFESDEPDGAA